MDHAADVVPLAELLDERRHLLEIAHRVLGACGAAEAVVAETYRRWYGLSDAARAQITAPRGWLAKTAGQICLARPASPDRSGTAGPGDGAGRGTGAAGRTPDELTDRARRSLSVRRSCPATPEQHDMVARAVRRACVTGDAGLLASLLAPDATAFFDGGGRVRVTAGPVHGRRQVAFRLLTLLAPPAHTVPRPCATLDTHSVNGRTGLVARYDHQVAAIIGLDVARRRVVQAWIILNPDKLRAWNQPRSSPDG
ncbi:RNA polymerase sigma factor [Streptomyces sulfonofaciens]|uniref:RNA polymerase sigma factor n=1 Tax=Streptomyces sulfonofaciens TaxID=68272 RepID=A0A919L848_9ACTN|nr:RNA polymerase subunit sigma [Streptomyces sulfonofaciens]GHH86919.1 RNA polymerase sigma factor [Streptomyces sulfonofaciens]